MAKKSQKNKRVSQSQLKDYSTTITILEHLSDAVFILRPDGVIEYANRVALDLLGLDLVQVIGENLNDFLIAGVDLPEKETGDSESHLLEQIFRGVFNEFETSLGYRNHPTPVLISFGLVRNKKGEVDYIIASAKDISVRKALEKELNQQQLLTLARDRYRELGEMAVNMVHNLSQPITSIRLTVELLLKQLQGERFDADRARKKIAEILTLLDELSASVTSVRNFAFLTEDDRWKPIDLVRNLHEALQQISYELTERNITLHINAPENLPRVLANPLNIQQVFTTLIKSLWQGAAGTNAPPSHLSIMLSNHEDRWITLWMVPKEEITDYRPLSEEQSSEVIQTNFDLMVVQMIITGLGGDVRVLTEPGGGKGFAVRFPVDVSAERDQLRNLIELMYNG